MEAAGGAAQPRLRPRQLQMLVRWHALRQDLSACWLARYHDQARDGLGAWPCSQRCTVVDLDAGDSSKLKWHSARATGCVQTNCGERAVHLTVNLEGGCRVAWQGLREVVTILGGAKTDELDDYAPRQGADIPTGLGRRAPGEGASVEGRNPRCGDDNARRTHSWSLADQGWTEGQGEREKQDGSGHRVSHVHRACHRLGGREKHFQV